MDIECDFSDIDDILLNAESEIDKVIDKVGKEAVEYAKENGSFQDKTGKLRDSNTYKVDNGLILENTAEYASHVESKGYEVLTGAVLYAEKRLKEEMK